MKAMKFCLITGASGDIGEACAWELADKGYSLYCHYYQNHHKIKKLIKELSAAFPEQDFFTIQADLAQDDSLNVFKQAIFQLDAIVFAHGDTIYNLLTEQTNVEFDYMWRIHLKLPMQLCQTFQSKLAQTSHGRIILISSVYGLIGSSMEVLYSTLKGGQLSFANAYAKEVASLGITVNAIAPGAVATQMNKDWTETETKELLENIPLNRMAFPKEIASLVSFLISDKANYMTGITLPITGGWKI